MALNSDDLMLQNMIKVPERTERGEEDTFDMGDRFDFNFESEDFGF